MFIGVGLFFFQLYRESGTEPRAFAATEVEVPTATISEQNGSCDTTNAHTTLDEGVDSADAVRCTADDGSADHDIHMNLGDPTITPGNLTNGQTFRIDVVRSSNGGAEPTVALDAYCGGVLHEAGADQQFPGNNPVVISETWTFGGSCTADGSNVEVFIDCTSPGGGGSRSCNFDAVEWIVNDAIESVGGAPIIRQTEFWF